MQGFFWRDGITSDVPEVFKAETQVFADEVGGEVVTHCIVGTLEVIK